MAPNLFSSGFFEELVKTLNNDPDFKTKTASVNASVLMVNKDLHTSHLLTISKGAATYNGPGTEETKADFVFIGDSATWIANHKGEIPMEKAVMTGKLKFKGSLPKIMGLRAQLTVIDNIAQKVPAEF
ncbi:MAG TPA: SCP2 sterol-binding domain-containing protein [Candidatus Thermoplasmatota archaeon]|nr:SCP2 sterol-binding domain-containing protein [Candidatus Thermoplasmatota archaeon]